MLEARLRAATTQQRQLLRIRIVLLAADGMASRAIAREVGVMTGIVSIWRKRFAAAGIEGLKDKPRPARQRVYSDATDKRILAVLDQPVPKGRARWDGPLIAEAAGRRRRELRPPLPAQAEDRSRAAARAGARARIPSSPPRPPMSSASTCPRPRTPSSCASTRSRRSRRWSAPRATSSCRTARTLTGHSHDYKRNGTTTLFAAYEVATGKVVAQHEKRRRRKEFLAFMDDVVAAYPGRRLKVILDNLNTHKKNEAWLAPQSPRRPIRPARPPARPTSRNSAVSRDCGPAIPPRPAPPSARRRQPWCGARRAAGSRRSGGRDAWSGGCPT